MSSQSYLFQPLPTQKQQGHDKLFFPSYL